MVSVGWLGLYITIDMHKCMVKTYNLLNSIWQTHATVDLCVSVFSTDMHSSSLGARPSLGASMPATPNIILSHIKKNLNSTLYSDKNAFVQRFY